MNDNSDIKLGVYIRVSTEEQANEGHSLDEQLDRIKRFCKFKDYKIYKIYKDDGKSAKDIDGRPMFKEMMEDIINGNVNAICIYKLDRLTRSIKDLEVILSLLEEYKCALFSVTEEINTKNAYGVFFIRMVILLAQLEIEQTKERTIMGLIGTVKKGIPIGKLPLGYLRDSNNEDIKLKKRAIIDSDTAPTIRRIFNLYLKGYSYYNIAEKLIEENNKLRNWNDSVIESILNNKLYYGTIEHWKSLKNKESMMFEDVVEPIISKEVFEECQLIMVKNKQSFGGHFNYLYGKTLYCAKCGSLLNVSNTKKQSIRHYICKKCNDRINENNIEKMLIEKLANITQFNMALTYNAIMVDDDRLCEVLNNVEIDVPDDRLRDRKEEIRDILDDLTISNIKDKTIIKSWNDMTYEEKREFIRANIDAIYIEKIKGSNQQNYKLEIKRIKFKQRNIDELFNLIRKNIVDLYVSDRNKMCSIAVMNGTDEYENYIKRLRKRYKIKVIEIPIRKDVHKSKVKSKELDNLIEKSLNEPNYFKTIKINKNKELLDSKFLNEVHYHLYVEME